MRKHVLVVDDEDAICETFSSVLEEAGYATDTARNGKEALERAQAHRPDVVILDLFMPVMDGVTFLDKFRAAKENQDVRVIVVTGCHQESFLRALPINSYLEKPIDLHTLLVEVEKTLHSDA